MRLTIRRRMLLYIIPSVVLITLASTVIVNITIRGMVKDLAYEKALETARQYANQLDVEFNSHLVILQTLSHMMQSYETKDRAEVTRILKQLVASDYNAVGIGVVYEPDAFDGRDALFRGRPGQDAGGRFMPYWRREDDEVQLGTTLATDDEAWYEASRDESEAMLEPALHGGQWTVRYVVPIRKDDEFRGACALDISVNYLNELINDIDLFKTGYAFLTSKKGQIITHRDSSFAGTTSLAAVAESRKSPEWQVLALRVEQSQEGFIETKDPRTGRPASLFFSPVRTNNWSLITVVPEDEIMAGVDAAVRWIVVAGLATIVVLSVMLFFISGRLATPIKVVADNMDQADLNTKLNLKRGDEIGRLANSFDRFVISIRDTLQDVIRTSNAVSDEGRRIYSQAEKMAAHSKNQATMAVSANEAVDQMSRSVDDIAHHAVAAREMAIQAQHKAEQGTTVVEQTASGVQRMVDQINQSAEVVNSLHESSSRIGRVIGLIEDITKQVNLIALNAAVEAAKAGERGKGFAVVAEEIKKLAHKTTRSTGEVHEMVTKIQRGISESVELMKKSQDDGASGLTLAGKAKTSFSELTDVFHQMNSMVNHIAELAHAFAATNVHIGENIHTINRATEDVSSSIESVVVSADQLQKLTIDLENGLKKFKMNGHVKTKT